ncbi:hypothetical protein [Paenibacillus agilis]|uniref:HPP family protein n=1 Tax=Paenibacillus agilis TaxID=3020863 RepID=A0A559J021_9BACL|nr:hypothetical protein [Paenibacillus agilis]TVX93211.1 hypothetical protein FPZ44_09165 [Paenibacillus agilis]
MNSAISKRETFISYFLAVALILGMVAAALLFNDREIILPEIAAMAIGVWVYREAGWIRQPSKLFIAPSLTAIIGFAVNQLDIAYLAKVSLTLALMMLSLRIIRSNLAPSIATGLLPLVTNATEWSFVLSVLVFTFILMLGVLLFRLNEGLEKKVPINYKYMLVFLVISFVWMGACTLAGFPQASVIPPILVVVYESLQKPMYNGKMAFKQALVLTISATVGTLLYYAIDSWIIVTMLDIICMLILLRIVGIRVPAVFAFPLLPFVFPEEVVAVLPLVALIATTCLFGMVLAYKKWEFKQTH